MQILAAIHDSERSQPIVGAKQTHQVSTGGDGWRHRLTWIATFLSYGRNENEFQRGSSNTDQQPCFGQRPMLVLKLLCCLDRELNAVIGGRNSPHDETVVIAVII